MPAPPASHDPAVRLEQRATEPRLARYARTRDPVERARLVMRFMPLARRLAERYRHTSESPDDLVQVAAIGLIHAIDRYDPTRRAAFTAFAVPTILGELRRHLRDQSWAVHVPRNTRELADRLTTASDHLAAELRRTPTAAELAERLGRPVEHVLEARAALACRTTTSLEPPPGRRGDALADVLDGGDGGVAQAEERVVVDDLLATLPFRHRAALRLRFWGELSQREIGLVLRLSQRDVSHTLRDGLEALRAAAGGAQQSPTER
jgi:RNA polymerase sigma-B factor